MATKEKNNIAKIAVLTQQLKNAQKNSMKKPITQHQKRARGRSMGCLATLSGDLQCV